MKHFTETNLLFLKSLQCQLLLFDWPVIFSSYQRVAHIYKVSYNSVFVCITSKMRRIISIWPVIKLLFTVIVSLNLVHSVKEDDKELCHLADEIDGGIYGPEWKKLSNDTYHLKEDAIKDPINGDGDHLAEISVTVMNNTDCCLRIVLEDEDHGIICHNNSNSDHLKLKSSGGHYFYLKIKNGIGKIVTIIGKNDAKIIIPVVEYSEPQPKTIKEEFISNHYLLTVSDVNDNMEACFHFHEEINNNTNLSDIINCNWRLQSTNSCVSFDANSIDRWDQSNSTSWTLIFLDPSDYYSEICECQCKFWDPKIENRTKSLFDYKFIEDFSKNHIIAIVHI